MWREPSFEKLHQLIKSLEHAMVLQAEDHTEKLKNLKAMLIAKAKAEGIPLPEGIEDVEAQKTSP